MEDPVFKQRYKKYKLRVKLWEKDFRKKHGRIPSKYDIREASQDIKDSYKMYYKLKTSFLEDTLNEALSDDGYDILEMTQRDGYIDVTETINGGPQLPLDISKLVEQPEPDGTHLQENCNRNMEDKKCRLTQIDLSNKNKFYALKEFEPVNVLTLNENAWGPKVAMKLEIKENKELPCKSLKTNFKEKLFKNSSFSLRNPRKSLSKSALDGSLRESQNNASETLHFKNKDVLPDLETILLQKTKEQQAVINPVLGAEHPKQNIQTQVDEGWLLRNAAQDEIEATVNFSKKAHKVEDFINQNLVEPRKKPVYGLSNFDLSKLHKKPKPEKRTTDQTDNNLENINSCLSLEFKPLGYKESPLEECKEFEAKSKSQESDSVVDDSEEEEESQEYRHIVKRRKINSKLPEKIETCQENGQMVCKDKITNRGDLKCYSLEHREEYDNCGQKKNMAKRKKVGAKKTSAKLKNSKNTTEKTAFKGKKIKTQLEKQTKSSRSSKKKLINCEKLHEEFEDKPLNTEDLKYSLALDRGGFTFVPRIKQTDLDKADNLAHKYIISTAPAISNASSSASISTRATDDKRVAAKRKLEEKIATGKLNENFVTINVQKKIFVRGKRTVNYSTYKKKLWKHKKHIAALSGPNMDMRGCDGGTLKCFNCGQVGHFANSCNVKGDSLLPLTAQLEDDASPFPTLQEAERMASQSAAAAHARNIDKMPRSANAAIYNQTKDDDSDKNVKPKVKFSTDTMNGDEENASKNNVLKESGISSATLKHEKNISPIKKYVGSKIPDDFLKAAGIGPTNQTSSNLTQYRTVEPLYDVNDDGSVKEVTTEVLEALRMFGHNNFRKGQDRAIMRILSGMSTLVTLSTGSGKSLCYQLPAYLYSKHKKSITLVISPLVSLMEDQVTGVPHFLRAHCMHTNQTPQQKEKVLKMIAANEIDVLLVSPEAVVSGERSTGFGSILRQLPPIAFACIDEAHCVSQWSHNFRPSYLMICKVLKHNLGIKCVLGLTATATLPTRKSIITHLGILDGDKGIISDIPIPDNLILSVSKDENRDSALLQLLLSKRFESCQSIIIYCTRRDECERIAGHLRTYLQDYKSPELETRKRKGKRVNWHAEPYHAGMPSSRRRTIQNAFMRNELRIVVATIAFGMGINKSDIRAVIHYNMPRNFESYVQEVGRAGRDNKISHCHLFLDANGADQNELKRHIYSNSLDRHVIRKLLQHIFVPCCCDTTLKDGELPSRDAIASLKTVAPNTLLFEGEEKFKSRPRICKGHEIGFSIEKTVEALDIPEENISTLLCYMELENRWCINVLSNAYIKAKIISYGGSKYLKHAAKECPPLAMAIAMEIKNGCFKEESNIIEFAVIDVAAAIGWNSGVVKHQLKNLEWMQVNGYPKRSPITVNFYDLGFRIKAPGDFTAEEIDEALDTLYYRSVKQEQTQLIQLQYIFQGLSSVAYNSYAPCCNATFSHDRSDQLKGIIREYFRNDYPKNMKLEIDPSNVSDRELESDVVTLINMYPENNFSGRNIARIFHGIPSPNYPAQIWYRCKFWRVHSKTDFNRIVQLANNVIVKRRT